MSTEAQKTALLEAFQSYLTENQTASFATQAQPDLHTLLSELTSLKTEVKAESRQFKNTLDTLASALESVQAENINLTAQLAANTEQLTRQHAEAMRVMLLQMIDLYDRVGTGVEVLEEYQPVHALFRHSQKKDVRFIQRFSEGQLMTSRRFQQLLHSHQVTSIECVGKLLDPLTMRAVETGNDAALENGLVLQEIRTGYLYQGQVLRLAEVTVNKITTG